MLIGLRRIKMGRVSQQFTIAALKPRKGEAALPTADENMGSNDATGRCTRLCAAGYAGYPLPTPIQGALCACNS